ncbi:MAG: NAD-dependent epimerase/dehydratase family protein [Deltaproteobacteria bacterium]|nr:NAD-dependent epimerase/dehydratase family protein [Deltaproteobacteria bacterium]
MTTPPSTRVLGVGHVGRRLLETLGADGLPARGTVRDPGRADLLRDAGLYCVPLDLDEHAGAASLGALLEEGEHLVVTLPPDGSGLRARALAQAVELARPGRVILLSSTGVYAEVGGGEVDEESPLADTPAALRRREMEATLAGACERAGAPFFALRLPAIYGHGRGLHRSLEAGRIRLWGGGEQLLNRIHVDDIVGAILAVMEAPADAAGVYNLSDDHPCTLREIVTWLCERLELPLPPEAPLEEAPLTLQGSKLVRSARLRERTGWAPRYPSYREGMAAAP